MVTVWPPGTGGGAGVVVDHEVVPVEAVGHGRAERHRFDGLVMPGVAQRRSDLA